MKIKKRIIAVSVVGIILVIGIYFIKGVNFEENDEKNKILNTEEFFKKKVECAEQDGYVICVEKSQLSRNTEVPLEVGKVFKYEVKREDGFGTDTYIVEKFEDINSRSYYVVKREFYFVDESDTIKTIMMAWYDKETGRVLKHEFDGNIIKGEVSELLVSDTWFFAPWMLALNDSFKLEIKFNDTYTERGYKLYEVVGREKINGKECFKVKLTTIVDSKIDSQAYWWIDTQKRILIKTSTGRILVSET
jgi:hypothetical protein